jgi:hypothetical protein
MNKIIFKIFKKKGKKKIWFNIRVKLSLAIIDL